MKLQSMYIMNSLENLFSFIENSPTSFHAIHNVSHRLLHSGFQELTEGTKWTLKKGGHYFVKRNQSSIIAFKIGNLLNHYSFQITASHSDSPTFKLKENAHISVKEKYTQLNTEGYGGMLCSTWLDRPLSIAGRVLVQKDNTLTTKLLNINKDLILIPNLAIHMNRNANDGFSYNKQKDMLPLLGGKQIKPNRLQHLIAHELQVLPQDIYGSDLYLYNRMSPTMWGADKEFFSAPRIDNLECAYASLEGFLSGSHPSCIQVYICFDNEEVGSGTKQGAGSTFLKDILERINLALHKDIEDLHCAIAQSLLLSCDNAHALHPNYPEKTDIHNHAYMNEGIVIKSHAGQKYTSDGVSIAILKHLCHESNIPYQFFSNRSDTVGGSTLGNILLSQVSLHAIDIGLAQLAMHSSYETAGVKDLEYMIRLCQTFYNSCIQEVNAYRLQIHNKF